MMKLKLRLVKTKQNTATKTNKLPQVHLVVKLESGFELECICLHTYPRCLKYHRMYVHTEQCTELLDKIKYENHSSAFLHCS